ncbi:MAG: deoxyribodipyrimidine photo-lyase [Halioglobus sp.]
MNEPIIFWFRQDLRIHDLPGLRAAVATQRPLIACYILDEMAPGDWVPGGASRWWLHQSLAALNDDLRKMGGRLLLLKGETLSMLQGLLKESGATALYCSRQYEPWAAALEHSVHDAMMEQAVDFRRFPGSLLFEPEAIATQSGGPFKVFTPFWRKCCSETSPASPKDAPENITWCEEELASENLEGWRLQPTDPDWASHWREWWQPGSEGALRRLEQFFDGAIENYDEGRDHPALEATTRLSPHLHFGEISPRQVWHAAREHGSHTPAHVDQVDKFLSELGWREFSYHLLHHFPDITDEPFREQFSRFPWLGSPQSLEAWQRGETGYPLVDAGMRELWQTGYMHNRIRMVVASFLTKHLLIHWRAGARWFWDTLVDADLANNSAGWQWVAGSGADASPYFRIFNPVTQGEKFDADGIYIRRWVPELAGLPDRYLGRPWEAPVEVLEAGGV